MIAIPDNYNEIFPYLNESLGIGRIHDIKDKFFFKALLKYNILYYNNIDDTNHASPLIFFSYYFMDKEKPLVSISKIFRNADMEVHVSPGNKLFACLTNHVISLKLKTSYTVWEYDDIFRLINIYKDMLSSYEIFVLFCFIVQNYLFTFDYWDLFVSKLKFFKKLITSDKFYITYLPSVLFFFSIMNLILSKLLLFTNHYRISVILYYSCYWISIII